MTTLALIAPNRALSLPLLREAVAAISADERTALLAEANQLSKEIASLGAWQFRKAVRLMEIGATLQRQDYLDQGWFFLRQLSINKDI